MDIPCVFQKFHSTCIYVNVSFLLAEIVGGGITPDDVLENIFNTFFLGASNYLNIDKLD